MEYEKSVPSLEQLCYEILAKYAGYIEDISELTDAAILEIAKKTDAFGLSNIDELLDDSIIDTSELWEHLYLKQNETNPGYFHRHLDILKGNDFCKQAVISSFLKNELETMTLDEDDILQLIDSSGGLLKILVFNKAPSIGFDLVLSKFKRVLYLDIQDTKIGSAAGEPLRNFIINAPFIHDINARNVILGKSGAFIVAEAIEISTSLNKLNLAFNDLEYEGVERLVNSMKTSSSLVILNISRNVGPMEIKLTYNLKKELLSVKPTAQLILV